MSNPPSDPSPPTPPYDIHYLAPPDNASNLLRLTVIFNYIAAGLDALTCLLGIGVGIFFIIAGPTMEQKPGDPPPLLLGIIYLCIGVLAIGYAIVKIIAARKLSNAAPHAWGWGLAAGIVGCAQLLCGSCCFLQVGAGIYTVVILCFDNVKRELSQRQSQAAGMGGMPEN